MADIIQVVTTDTLVYTGLGQVAGVVLTNGGASSAVCTFYDNTAGSGTKILEFAVNPFTPVVLFFADRFAPRFDTGLYVKVGTDLHVVLWARTL